MRSLKAITTGIIFIIVISLLMQLAYIFVAVAYNSLANNYSFLADISGSLNYLVGIPLFMLIMFSGGYITALIATKRVVLHCAIVASVTTGGMILWSLENAQLSLTGIIVFILAILSASAGGIYWQRDYKLNKNLNKINKQVDHS